MYKIPKIPNFVLNLEDVSVGAKLDITVSRYELFGNFNIITI